VVWPDGVLPDDVPVCAAVVGVVGVVATGVVVVVALEATRVVSFAVTERGGSRMHAVPFVGAVQPVSVSSLGGAGRKAIVASVLLASRTPELQSGLQVLVELFEVWSTPSAAGSWGDAHVMT
jgi:hypothetical protein